MLGKNAGHGNVESFGQNKEASHQILKVDSSKFESVEVKDLDVPVEMVENIGISSYHNPKSNNQ